MSNQINPSAASLASTKKATILICDRNPVLAEGMRLILQAESHLDHFSIISTTETDVNIMAGYAPRLLIVDPWQCVMPGVSVADAFEPLSATTSLIGYCPDIAPTEVRVLSLAGFRGLMPKTVQSQELVRIVLAVIFGGVYLHEIYSDHYVPRKLTLADTTDQSKNLTDREKEVLRHVALGCSMKEISSLLRISTKTVDTYKARANQKLNLHSRADIVRYAIQSGWMN